MESEERSFRGCLHNCKTEGICPPQSTCCNDACCRIHCDVPCSGAACFTDYDCGIAYNCDNGCCELKGGWWIFDL